MTGAIHPLTMPKWGLAMTEGMLAAWNVEEGARIEPGTEVLDIETSKITNALEAQAAGVLRRRTAEAGQTLPVGALLGVIAEPDVPEAEIDAFVEAFQAQAAAAAEATAEPPKPETVTVDGKPIRSLAMGEGEGPPIVLIHGFGGDLNNWLFTQGALAEKHRVYAIDLPGHGGSTKDVGDGGIGTMARTLLGFLDAVGAERAHLVGHSMGGAIALAAAQSNPDRVASLTLIASGGLGDEIDASYLDGFIAASKRKDLKPHLEKLFANAELVTRDLVEDVLKYKRLDGVDAALKAIRGKFLSGDRQSGHFRDRLAGIKVPVQVIFGREDRIIPAKHAEGLPGNIDIHVLDGKGHMVHMEAAAEVNRLIEGIVARG